MDHTKLIASDLARVIKAIDQEMLQLRGPKEFGSSVFGYVWKIWLWDCGTRVFMKLVSVGLLVKKQVLSWLVVFFEPRLGLFSVDHSVLSYDGFLGNLLFPFLPKAIDILGSRL